MSTQADIKSIDTLSLVKLALISYAHASSQALADIEIEGQRGIDWITVDRAAYWKAEMRRAADGVNQAIKDLEHCRAYKKVGDNAPSCAEEKKNLEKARKRLQKTEEKLELVKRWTPVVLQQYRETCVRLVRFREVIDVDCPRAIARIEQMLTALENYQTVAGPRGTSTSGDSNSQNSVARQTDARDTEPTPEEGTDL
ncbi:hypothetical protein N9B10_02630 [Pirellulales bacterium]|nr:hypothetical protein [Pirellulales bacterium]